MTPIEQQTALAGNRVLALFGPTSVGKSELAVVLAERLAAGGRSSVVIAADSIQIYEGLALLSGAASAQQRARAEHKLIGCVPINVQFSAGQYGQLAHQQIDAALASGQQPIVVGGTGLYLQAALTEMPLRPPLSPETEARLQARLADAGAAALHAELAELSAAAAQRIAVSDERRILRALGLLSEGHSVDDQEGGIWTAKMRHPTRLIGLVRSRDELYERIDQRVEEIAAAGGADEVRAALAAGASRTARHALGFRELQTGDLEAMKRATRNYAKRQMTWLRKLAAAEMIEIGTRSAEEVADAILSDGDAADA